MSEVGWVFMVQPDFDGKTSVPDSQDVVRWHEARGWVRAELPTELDPNAPDEGTTHAQARAEEEVEGLKGEALDEALKAAGLPRTGTADEKRARLAEHEAELAETTEGEK